MSFLQALIGLIRSRELCTIAFQFSSDFESSSIVKVKVTGTLPKDFAVWVWDLFYTKVLYTMGHDGPSDQLKQHLERWAEPVAADFAATVFGGAWGMDQLKLDETLRLTEGELSDPDTYTMRVMQVPQRMPYIRTELPQSGFQNRLGYSVIVFAQHLINQDNDKLMAWKLAVNVLSLRKYYCDIASFTDLASTNSAPLFALKESEEIYRDVSNVFGDCAGSSQ